MDLSNGNYYLIDLFTYFPLSILMVMSVARKDLSAKYPYSNIFNIEILIKVIGILMINLFIDIFALFYYLKSPLSVPVFTLT